MSPPCCSPRGGAWGSLPQPSSQRRRFGCTPQTSTDRFSQRTHIFLEYESNCVERFVEEVETHLFRIAPEALTNIARHAGAQKGHVCLRKSDQRISLRVSDDGVGIPDLETDLSDRPTLGMVGMRARARNCGGNLNVRHVQPHGLCVEAVIPPSGNPMGSPFSIPTAAGSGGTGNVL